MRNTYLAVGMGLTLILVIWAIIAGNSDAIPQWTIAIPAVVSGFWWAFGRSVIGDGNPRRDHDAPPAPQPYTGDDR